MVAKRSPRYGEYESQGAKWAKWLRNPYSCPIPRSLHTVRSLRKSGWSVRRDFRSNAHRATRTWDYLVPPQVVSVAAKYSLETRPVYKRFTASKLTQDRRGKYGCNKYSIQVGPGIIFALSSNRVDGPHWSEIAWALYRRQNYKEGLRVVLRVDISNEQTMKFIQEELYTSKTGYIWPDPEPREWKMGTHEYQALLGTPNARAVAALVLTAFPPGTRHIPVILTWADENDKLQMLFAIANETST
ncbi:hypothetical protein N7462_006203 [Penicillium macrosclerotiorum]|uniref:uncharacterized protein n=1 Tax=Penicillium macrosclerotiorum TaxID=303699 RepID=UPI00254909E8|nr:uncharacterized protein N7462_006203 [Penicillium macrosclerotiorum]KAJ5683038.1 hypothetical protein N7462_006203 [Penicillium macrosclerotiorum]